MSGIRREGDSVDEDDGLRPGRHPAPGIRVRDEGAGVLDISMDVTAAAFPAITQSMKGLIRSDDTPWRNEWRRVCWPARQPHDSLD